MRSTATSVSPPRTVGTSRTASRIAALTRNPPAVLAGVSIIAAVIYWIAFTYRVRGVHFDDGVSVLAARSILEYGYPKLPSEFFYHRAYLHHYLLAASILAFGVNSLAVMVPSLVFGVGSLVLVYRISSRLLGMPWLGAAIVAVLPLLQIFSWYATGPRMYMTLAFFTLLGSFVAWRGYIEGVDRYRPLTVVILLLAILSHEQGIMAAMAIIGAVALVLLRERRLSVEARRVAASPLMLGLVAGIAVTAWFVHVFEPGSFRPIVIHDGTPPDRVGLNLSPVFWGMHLARIEEAVPFGLPFVLVGLLSLARSRERRALTYLALVMSLGVLVTGFALRDGGGPRLFFFVIPLYVMFAIVGVVSLVQILRAPSGGRSVAAALAVFLVGLGVSTMLGTLLASGSYPRGSSVTAYMRTALSRGLHPATLASNGFGLPCGRTRVCARQLRADYDAVRRLVNVGDIVVATAAMQTSFYLGRVDAWLRSRELDDGQLGHFDEPTDEYFGVQLVDTPEELRALARQPRTVWIVMQGSAQMSLELSQVLGSDFEPAGVGRTLRVFRNRAP